MPKKRQSVTIQDVAKAAGVSVSTVSRVLNAKADVARDTQKRILTIIEELGYTSNLAARSMRSQKKNLIGLVVPDIGLPYSIEIMKGINQAIAESNYDLLVYTTGAVQKNSAKIREQHYVSLLNNSLTDGVIIVASAAAEFITDAPIVAVDPHAINPNYPSVQGTNYEGAIEAMDFLLSLGHRRIGFICGRPEIGSAVLRLKAYKEVLLNAGIESDESLIVPGDFSTERGRIMALQLLSSDDPPSAIFAANDQSAIGVFQAAEELGLNIPDELSVIGFDNISEAQYLGLTTINQNLSAMGYKATQFLIKMIQKESLENQVFKMDTNLVIRSSCKAV
ncbi:MAG: LacI family DNA-binding transcriptional regulator [Anaerolineaceae bacterium]|nr:LacI family DNA-binding transcriptional regulator [Anaerolineaceae bacterium]